MAALLLWPPGLARGQNLPLPKTAVAIVGFYPEPTEMEQRLTQQLGVELAAQGLAAAPAPAIEAALREEAQRRREPLAAFQEEIDSELKEVKRLYDNLRFQESLTLLKQLQARLEENFARLRSQKSLLQVHLYRGMNLIALGEKDRAQGAFEDLLRYDANRQSRLLNARNFPPRILKVFDIAKRSLLSKDKADLTLHGTPAGAAVYLNGALLGPLPQQISALPLGDHYLVVTADGYETWAQRLFVDVGRNALRVELKKTPLFAVEETAPSAAGREALKRLAGRSGADLLLLAELKTGEAGYLLSGAVYDNRTDRRGEARRLSGKTEEELRRGMKKWLQELLSAHPGEGRVSAAGAVPPAPLSQGEPLSAAEGKQPLLTLPTQEAILPPPPMPPADEALLPRRETPFYHRTWFWLVVAGVAGGAAAGTLLMTGGKSGAPVLVIRPPR